MKAIVCFGIYMILPALFSCEKPNIFFSDKLSLERQDYTGNQLRIDGYYYNLYDTLSADIKYSYFFYRNGVVLSGSAGSNFEELEETFNSEGFTNNIKKNRSGWGLFKIYESEITIEEWVPMEPPYHAYTRSGEIIDDTTFVITKSWRNKRKKETLKTINEVYHFKQFSPKPDSTNTFID